MVVELLRNCVCESVFNGENHKARHVWMVFHDIVIIKYTELTLFSAVIPSISHFIQLFVICKYMFYPMFH